MSAQPIEPTPFTVDEIAFFERLANQDRPDLKPLAEDKLQRERDANQDRFVELSNKEPEQIVNKGKVAWMVGNAAAIGYGVYSGSTFMEFIGGTGLFFDALDLNAAYAKRRATEAIKTTFHCRAEYLGSLHDKMRKGSESDPTAA